MTAKTASVYSIPTTGAQIIADTIANTGAEFPELRTEIEAGSPVVRVDAATDGYRNCRATIWAGVRLQSGEFIPAHLTGADADDTRFTPQVKFRAPDGRLSAGDNARKVLGRFFALADDTAIEWVSVGL